MRFRYLFICLGILLALLSTSIFVIGYSGTSVLLHTLIIIDIVVGFVLSVLLNVKYVKNKMYISSIICAFLTIWFIILVLDYVSSFYLTQSILGGVSILIYPIFSFSYSLPILVIVIVNAFFEKNKLAR